MRIQKAHLMPKKYRLLEITAGKIWVKKNWLSRKVCCECASHQRRGTLPTNNHNCSIQLDYCLALVVVFLWSASSPSTMIIRVRILLATKLSCTKLNEKEAGALDLLLKKLGACTMFFYPVAGRWLAKKNGKKLTKRWWHKWQSDGILSGKARFKPSDRHGLFSVQNCCQSILTGCEAFSKNVKRTVHTLPSSYLFLSSL